jgi:hypothetical protein
MLMATACCAMLVLTLSNGIVIADVGNSCHRFLTLHVCVLYVFSTPIRPHAEKIGPCLVIDSGSCAYQDHLKVKKRHTGQGGAWHAFCSRAMRGRSGRADYKALAIAYSELKPGDDLFEAAHEMGAFATKVRRIGGHHLKPFGAKTSRVRDMRQRELESILVVRGRVGQARAVLRTASGNAVGDFINDLNLTIQQKLTLARRQARMHKQQSAQDEKSVATLLKDWEEKEGAKQLDDLFATMPFLRTADYSFKPVPSVHLKTFDLAFPDGGNIAKMASRMKSDSRTSNVQSAVDSYVGECGQPLQRTSCHSEPAPPDASVCRDFGCCVCPDSPHLPMWMFRNGLFKAMKTAFPARQPLLRKFLVDGFAVLRFLCIDDMPAASCGPPSEPESYYMHVGLMYLSPYRPTMQMLSEGVAPPGEPIVTATRKYVKVRFRI